MMLSRASAAVVPQGSVVLTITPASSAGTSTTYSAACADGTATAAVSGTSVTVTGVTVGSSTVTVTGTDGSSATLPVQVYDPFVIDTGELLVTVVSQFTQIGISGGYLYPDMGITLWQPAVPTGFYALGSYWSKGLADPSGTVGVLSIKPKTTGSTAMVVSNKWTQKGNCDGLDSLAPVPDPGYVALGRYAFDYRTDVSQANYAVTVRQDLTAAGTLTPFVDYLAPDNYTHFFWWKIDQPSVVTQESVLLAPGTWAYQVKYGGNPVANVDPAANVLQVHLPLLADAPERSWSPTMTSYDSAPMETPVLFAKAMLVPCTAIVDPIHLNDAAWQVTHSPFYRLERNVFYKLMYSYNNKNGSLVQPGSVAMTSGITKEHSQEFSQTTGISISAESGIEIGAISGKVTATISKELGYTTSTAVSDLEEITWTASADCPVGKAVALWQKFNRFILYRHNGTVLEEVGRWDVGIKSFVLDEYP